MSRELLLWMLALLFVGSLTIVTGAWLDDSSPPVSSSARLAEQAAWRKLWLPLLPGALILAFLFGWALQEPESAEALHAWAYLCAAPLALVWARALWRAWRSGSATQVRLAGTVGLLRPRVVIEPELCHVLDGAALEAARAHEAAHVRHKDPLRLWLAQVATDLQWPAVAARRRLHRWRQLLELARDEEACARGDTNGPDLAAAVVAAARLAKARVPAVARGAVAPLGAVHGQALVERINRLLATDPPSDIVPTSAWARLASRLAVMVVVAGMVAIGYFWGEAVVSNIAEI